MKTLANCVKSFNQYTVKGTYKISKGRCFSVVSLYNKNNNIKHSNQNILGNHRYSGVKQNNTFPCINVSKQYFTNKGNIQEEEFTDDKGEVVTERYSKALYNVGKKRNKEKEIYSDLIFIRTNLLNNKAFLNFLKTPNIDNQMKINFFVEELKKYKQFNDVTIAFLKTIFESNRLNYLDQIIDTYSLLVMKEKREIKCVVYTAKEVNENFKKKIYDSIIYKLKDNTYKPVIEYEINKSILGGLILKIGNKIYDFSATSKVSQIIDRLS